MQITVRSDEPELERRIRELARREGISLNQAAVRLLRRGVGLGQPADAANRIGARLDHLAGTWSDEEAEEIGDALALFDVVDKDAWR